ncbi:MAG: Gfo/Idh/MocA family oxidoreductase [Planctomycetes bacterium]|nr:Gfo/Idh/MocA family oxidoreductase [Planctomycetota bacterium]
MNRKLTRRTFLAAGAAATAIGVPGILRAQNSPNRLRIAIIGCGGRGAANLSAVSGENIVALCDVSQATVDAAAARFPKARRCNDFRTLFDHQREFDAVVVSTCEHTHAFATMLALVNNKHVYCEKPLTHGIWEARQIRERAARTKVATQMGIQIHATNNYRQVVELIQGGAIGGVREVHVWVSRAWGLQSPEAAKRNRDIVTLQNRPKEVMPVPAGLNWQLWIGPAPERPFHSTYVPGPKWYRWWDFGSGTMSDLGSHWIDLPFWALRLRSPQTIEASGPPPHRELAPASMSATYQYAARGDQPAVRLTWYQGELKPQIWRDRGIPQWNDGCLFIGARGMLLSNYSQHVLLPERDFANFRRPDPTLPRNANHHREWIDAAKGNLRTLADFEYSGWLTEANHLGNVAYRLGRRLEWDAANLRCTNLPEANALIRREYRRGWEL